MTQEVASPTPAAFREQTFGFLVNDVARTLRKRFDRRAASLGLTRAQWSVLFHLARNEGVNQRTLAATLEIEPITLTRILDRMEASDWIVRQPDPRDRRAYLLHLTPKARPVLEKLHALAAETRQEALAGIAASDQAHATSILERIKENLLRALAADREAAGTPKHEN